MVPDVISALACEHGLGHGEELAKLSGRHIPVFTGMHVNADGQGNARDKVELRFTSADAPDKVAAWYRDGARAETFAIASAVEKNGAYTLSGTEVEDGDPFTLQLAPRGAGTDARLTLQDKN